MGDERRASGVRGITGVARALAFIYCVCICINDDFLPPARARRARSEPECTHPREAPRPPNLFTAAGRFDFRGSCFFDFFLLESSSSSSSARNCAVSCSSVGACASQPGWSSAARAESGERETAWRVGRGGRRRGGVAPEALCDRLDFESPDDPKMEPKKSSSSPACFAPAPFFFAFLSATRRPRLRRPTSAPRRVHPRPGANRHSRASNHARIG